MGTVFTDVPSWVIAGFLALAMLGGLGIGWWRGHRLRQCEDGAEPGHTFNDATMALLGLLLGFTFSLALGKHDERRQMVVMESNSIGDFLTCVSLLNEPTRSQLRTEVRAYAEIRLAMAKAGWDEANVERDLRTVQDMHGRMQLLVGQALAAGTPIAIPLVNTFNEVTSSHAARLAAGHDRLPTSIVLVLCIAAILAMTLAGVRHGTSGERPVAAALGFSFLICLVIQVTLDLNQPQKGLIRVSQEPLERLLQGMEK